MRKIAVVTGTRAEYGILYPVLRAIEKHPELELSLIVAGMHLSHEFGYTVEEIERDGFKIDAKIDMLLSDDTGARMAKSFGIGVMEIAQTLEMIKPDMILVLGDREEPFAAAVAGTCMNIPVAHVAGGEVATGGHIDESIRHSITKFAHIHFPSTKKSVLRIIKLGEEPWRVHVVGSPVLDVILSERLLSANVIAQRFSLDLSRPVILVVQHPLTLKPEESSTQIRETMEALVEIKEQSIVIYPNTDAGGRRMINVIKKYEKYHFIKTFKNLSRKDYLSLMKMASVMVGNSSSGIIEAPSFHLPVVNIGSRQEGRERSTNVIDVGHDKREIINAIKKALHGKKFLAKVKKCKNPYGDGKASQRIVKVLSEIKITPKLLQKKITY